MSFELSKVLLQGFNKAELAPFYILKASAQTPSPKEFLQNWLTSFFGEILKSSKDISLEHACKMVEQGHADILWPRREDQNKNYSLKDGELDELFTFMQYGALELPWRFAVVEDPQRLSSTYLNKLLKTLEEPAKKTSVFFLDYENTKFLSTIHSRAVEFMIPDSRPSVKWQKPENVDDIESWLTSRKAFYPLILENEGFFNPLKDFLKTGKELSVLVEKIRTTPNSDKEIAGIITEYEADRPGRHQQKKKLCQELKWFQESKTFNNAPWERVLGLLLLANS